MSDSLNNNPNLQRVNIYATNGVALLYVGAQASADPATGTHADTATGTHAQSNSEPEATH